MGVVAAVVGGLVGSMAAKALTKPKAAAQPAQMLSQPQMQVRPNSAAADALQARSGARVNRRTGARGAEYAGGMKTKLGQ